jgi:hypothetical protein
VDGGIAAAFAIYPSWAACVARNREEAHMRKIYTFRRARDGFTATRVLLAMAVIALVTGLLSHHGIEWPRQAVASAALPMGAPTQASGSAPMGATRLPDSTVYFPSQYELHAGPPEPLPATF